MRAVIFSLVCVVALANPSLAYNATGHKVIASIVYRQLSESERATLLDILKQHPRYSQDFEDAMPNDVRHDDEDMQAEWLFQQAAIWPDVVKSGTAERRAFNRPGWHYVNVPHYLTTEDRDEFEDSVDVNLEDAPPADEFDDSGMNVVQAISNSLRILHGDDHDDSQKAVHICWLLHLIGDLHQPLHATALFSRGLFPHGDRGGNAVKTQPLRNLHAAWDGAFGSSTSFTNCRNLAIQLVNRQDFDSLRQLALATNAAKDWRDQSFDVAKQHAYSHEVILQLEEREQDGDIDHNPVQLSDDYLRSRRAVADRLAVLAGVRCASALVGELRSAAPAIETRGSRARLSVRSAARAALNAVRPNPADDSTSPRSEQPTSDESLRSELKAVEEKLDRVLQLLEDREQD